MALTRDYLADLDEQIDIAPANSQEELDAANYLAQVFEEHKLETSVQEFTAPALGRAPHGVALVVMFVGVLLMGLTPTFVVGFMLVLISIALLVAGYMGTDLLEKVGPKANSQNVVGFHPATGKLVTKGNRPIVIVAHYDTPREDLLSRQPIARFKPLIASIIPICVAVIAGTALLQLMGFLPEIFRRVMWVVSFLASIPVVVWGVGTVAGAFLPCTVGANDNKSGVAALLSVVENVRPSGRVTRFPIQQQPAAPVAPEQPTDDNLDGFDSVEPAATLDAELAPEQPASVDDGLAAATATPVEPVASAEPESLVAPAAGVAAAAVAAAAVAAPAVAAAAPVPSTVRHGEQALRNLGALSPDCEIEYVDDAPAAPVEPVAAAVAPAAPTMDAAPEQPVDAYTDAFEAPSPYGEPDAFASQDADQAAAAYGATLADDLSAVPAENPAAPAGPSRVEEMAHQAQDIAATAASAVMGFSSKITSKVKDLLPKRAPKTDDAPTDGADVVDYVDDAFPADDVATADVATADAPEQPAIIDEAPTAGFVPLSASLLQPIDDEPTEGDGLAEEVDPDGTQPMTTPFTLVDDPGTLNGDIAGLDASDPGSTQPMDPATMAAPPAPEDPSWGQSTFQPQPLPFARRATLFDLPDPMSNKSPFDSTDPSGQPLTPAQVSAPAPRPAAPSPAPAMRRLDADVTRKPFAVDEDATPLTPVGDDIQVIQAPVSTKSAKPAKPAKAKKKRGGLFGLGKKKQEDESLSEWLGVDEDFDAQKDGNEIGSWDNFGKDDDNPDGWKGGAARGGDSRSNSTDGSMDEVLRDAVLHMGDEELISHDIWFVAVGGSSLDHAGIKAFLKANRPKIRGAFLFNFDCVGAGTPTVFTTEGRENTRNTDRRLVRLLNSTADALHIDLQRTKHAWCDTDATPAMRAHVRAATIMGVDENGLPALSHTADDLPESINPAQISALAELVTESIRRS